MVVPVSKSTTIASVLGIGRPMVPARRSPRIGLQWVTGASESPYPSTSLAPVSRSNCSCTGTGRGAAPEIHALSERKLYCSTFGAFARTAYIVGTPGKKVGCS